MQRKTPGSSKCNGRIVALADLPIGRRGEVVSLALEGFSRLRLLDLGLVPGTEVKAVRRSPANDPVAFNIRGAMIALRNDDGRRIMVQYQEQEQEMT
ncbi:MAG TPA: ferrous iron transport protein A [Firmicutes bacterium]|nr:ferrous iron transport protein A [Bacillota bacterium]